MDCPWRPVYDLVSGHPFNDLLDGNDSKIPRHFCLVYSSDAANAGGLSELGGCVRVFCSYGQLRDTSNPLLLLTSGLHAERVFTLQLAV